MVSPHHEPPKIPGFRHRRLIGAGASSVVFLYEWEQEKVDVAVKVWNDRLSAEDHDALAASTKEVADLGAHPYVLPLHAAGLTDDDRSFVLMDYRVGGDLTPEWEGERLSPAEALSITIKLAGALDVAARHGILHGDVKPANILLTGGGEPQLVGFGSLSTAGRNVGIESTSLRWMAPEMLAEPPEPSAWADIWSLAATCYTLLAGRTPFEGPNGDNTTQALHERIREYDPLAIGRSDVPASFEAALRKAMFKRRAGRHWSAADFAKALQAVEADLGLQVTPLAEMPEVRPDDTSGLAEVISLSGRAAGKASAPASEPTPPSAPSAPVEVPPTETTKVRTISKDEVSAWLADAMAAEDGKTRSAPKGEGVSTYAVAFQEPAKVETAPEPAPSEPDAPTTTSGDTAEVPVVIGPVPTPVTPAPAATTTPEATPKATPETIAAKVAPDVSGAPEPTAHDDVLGHRVDVDRVARLLASEHTSLPLAVAIQGLPGSGRSTFMRKVQERIEWLAEHDDAYPAATRHVRIDARQYAEGDVASGVLARVRASEQAEPSPAPAPPPPTSPVVARHQAAQRRSAELRAALAGLPEDDGARGKRRVQPMTTSMALAAMEREVAAHEAALRAAPPGPPPTPPPSSPPGGREASQESGQRSGQQDARTIVYVDDLDRCDPATAAGVLQAIDELSDQDGVAVVAAVDAHTLQRSIQGRVAEPAAYLSRVFDVPFALRAFAGDPAVRFMRSLMRQAVPSWPSALAASGSDQAARSGAPASYEMPPGEALFISDLARFCATPGDARKLLAVYRLARTAPAAGASAEAVGHHALGILMAILVGAPAQAGQVLGAVVESLAAGEDGATFRKLLEKVAREHTTECGRATCGSCAGWSRVLRAHADLAKVQQVPQEVGAYAEWVDEVARFSFPS